MVFRRRRIPIYRPRKRRYGGYFRRARVGGVRRYARKGINSIGSRGMVRSRMISRGLGSKTSVVFAQPGVADNEVGVGAPVRQGYWRDGMTRVAKGALALGSAFNLGSVASSINHGAPFGVGGAGIRGSGDYYVSRNVLTGRGVVGSGQDPPSFKSRGRNTMIQHREFIADITGSTAFTVQNNISINPGLPALLPWGSSIAQNFEQYNIRGMVFEFKTTSATALVSGTNTSMGTVIMATEYNSLNPQFSSKAQMENHEFSTSSVPSCSFLHPIECSRKETSIKNQYVRTGGIPAGADQRLYDLGNFQIATVGQQSANIIGELWVFFSVCLVPGVFFPMMCVGVLFDRVDEACSHFWFGSRYS